MAATSRPIRGMAVLGLSLDPDSSVPLYDQIYSYLRKAVLSGQLGPGSRLPSSRLLAEEIGCSRNTVKMAFDQLQAEGYLVGKSRSGTYVSAVLPENLLSTYVPEYDNVKRPAITPRLSRDGLSLVSLKKCRDSTHRAFALGDPDFYHFRFDVWGRILSRIWKNPPTAMLRLQDPMGFLPLREAIAEHLKTARGINCHLDQIMITDGASGAMRFLTSLLVDPGDGIIIEDPTNPEIRGAMSVSGGRIIPQAVDSEGMTIPKSVRRHGQTRLMFVTPSHQFPLGYVMSLKRRLELLDWADQADVMILEDDYDSEFRYTGRPISPLKALDEVGRVIYIGSFSKTSFTTMRLGYIVYPEGLVDAACAARGVCGLPTSMIAQPAMAEFLREGYLFRHIRKMRTLYSARLNAIREASIKYFDGLLTLLPCETGMYVVTKLSDDLVNKVSDIEAAKRIEAAGVVTRPLSPFYLDSPQLSGLLLGFAAFRREEIFSAAEKLAAALANKTDKLNL